MRSDNRFGMFIHWGIYALTESHEQAFAREDIPREKYEALADRFIAAKFDPRAWVRAAREAGMEYICFTAKHHDGFCMWDTKYTDYNVMNTPCGRDVLRELYDACQEEGMRLSIYYSIPDWHHPDARNPASTHQWKSHPEGEFRRYMEYLLGQIEELLTNYGPIYSLFWDIPPHVDAPQINAAVRRLAPGILINDRGFDPGDFSTPEREEAEDGRLAPYGHRTEACNSLDAVSWGYRRDSDYYALRHILASIDTVMARGGSYLLNLGPTAEGELPEEQLERLCRIGRWYRRVEEGLSGTVTEDFPFVIHRNPRFVATRKGNTTYFHFPEGLPSDALTFIESPDLPKRVRCLNTGVELPFAREENPAYFDMQTGRSHPAGLRIRRIPVDELCAEPIVIAVDWK